MTCTFDNTAWPLGGKWLPGSLPQPNITVMLACLELETLIEDHFNSATSAADQHDYDAELSHVARESYLRQCLAMVAHYRLTPDRKGNA